MPNCGVTVKISLFSNQCIVDMRKKRPARAGARGWTIPAPGAGGNRPAPGIPVDEFRRDRLPRMTPLEYEIYAKLDDGLLYDTALIRNHIGVNATEVEIGQAVRALLSKRLVHLEVSVRKRKRTLFDGTGEHRFNTRCKLIVRNDVVPRNVETGEPATALDSGFELWRNPDEKVLKAYTQKELEKMDDPDLHVMLASMNVNRATKKTIRQILKQRGWRL